MKLLLALALVSFAYLVIGCGTTSKKSGAGAASSKPYFHMNLGEDSESLKSGKAIFKSLGGKDAPVSLQDENIFYIEVDSLGFMKVVILQSAHTIERDEVPASPGNVTFIGPASLKLYQSMNAKKQVLMGATTKRAGNLTCAQIVVPGNPVRCTLTHVINGASSSF